MQLKSIEKHLKASKSSYKAEGSLFEQYISEKFHGDKETRPILVDPDLLRKRGLGQVDCCYLKKGNIYIIECKTGGGLISGQQKRRLSKTAIFLSLVFDKPNLILKFRAVAKTGSGHYSFNISNIKELN